MTDNAVLLRPTLEPEAQAFSDATANPPFLPDLGPEKGRIAVDDVQSGEIAKPTIDEEWITVPGGPTGEVKVRIVKPAGAQGTLPVIFYIHGAGWVFGDAHTHDRLVRELAVGSDAAVVFPEYDRSPEAPYPTAIEQNYAAAQWVMNHGAEKGLDASRMAVAGDSVGGNMAIALDPDGQRAWRCRHRRPGAALPGDRCQLRHRLVPAVRRGLLPAARRHAVVLGSVHQDPNQRAEITASPLRASTDQLAGLPPALVITGEADVLRDEGEAYAAKLRAAGVPTTAVRFGGIIHDFMMLNALRPTHAAQTAIDLTTSTLRTALH